MTRFAALTIAVTLTTAFTASQSTGTATLTGTVVDDLGRTVARARVGLVNSAFAILRSTLTSETGEFRLEGVAAGTFWIAASKSSYADTLFGQVMPGLPGVTVTLTTGTTTNVNVRLPRGGAISGVVRDAAGSPIPGASVRVVRRGIVQGRLMLEGAGIGGRTNSVGEFRVYGLAAGRYLVNAMNDSRPTGEIRQSDTSADGAAIASVPFYYPSALSPSAARDVRVNAGEETSKIDVTIADVPAARVEGTVDNHTEATLSSSRVAWIDDVSDPFAQSIQSFTTVSATGQFTLLGVPEGQHVIIVRASGRPTAIEPMGAGPFWAWAEITTAGAPATVNMELRRGATVSAKVVPAEGSLPDLSKTSFVLDPKAGPFAREFNGANQHPIAGTFSFANVPPGMYSIRVQGPMPAGWTLASVLTSAGLDVLDTGLDVNREDITGLTVVLTARPTSLSGTVTVADGRAPFDQLVGVFSIDRRAWTPGSRRVRLVQPDLAGHYVVTGLPPGDYFVVYGAEKAGNIEVDPSGIGDLISQSVRVSLAPGEKKVQDFRNR